MFIKTLLLVQIVFVTYFILLPGASLLPDVTYVHIVLATSLISLLHTVLDGGPRKWTYEDPNKPMTYSIFPFYSTLKICPDTTELAHNCF